MTRNSRLGGFSAQNSLNLQVHTTQLSCVSLSLWAAHQGLHVIFTLRVIFVFLQPFAPRWATPLPLGAGACNTTRSRSPCWLHSVHSFPIKWRNLQQAVKQTRAEQTSHDVRSTAQAYKPETNAYRRIIFNLKISRFLTVSSWPGTLDARFFKDFMIMDRASFLASFFSSSSVRFSRNCGTISIMGKKNFFTVCKVKNS